MKATLKIGKKKKELSRGMTLMIVAIVAILGGIYAWVRANGDYLTFWIYLAAMIVLGIIIVIKECFVKKPTIKKIDKGLKSFEKFRGVVSPMNWLFGEHTVNIVKQNCALFFALIFLTIPLLGSIHHSYPYNSTFDANVTQSMIVAANAITDAVKNTTMSSYRIGEEKPYFIWIFLIVLGYFIYGLVEDIRKEFWPKSSTIKESLIKRFKYKGRLKK